MSEASDRRIALKKDIRNGKLSLDDVKREVRKMKEEFGEDAFLAYELDKKERPWDEEYLKELDDKGRSGAGSEEFILHFAEVKEEVAKRKKRRLLIGGIIGGVAIAVGIVSVTMVACHNTAPKTTHEKKTQIESKILPEENIDGYEIVRRNGNEYFDENKINS